MAALTRWRLVRHAPTAAKWRGRIVGKTDAEAHLDFDPTLYRDLFSAESSWIVTPLSRTQQTALRLGADPAAWTVVPALAEQDFGAWEGRTWADLADDPAAAAFWGAYHRIRPPEGESLGDVARRARRAFREMSASLEGREIVAVLHAGTIRALLCGALGIPLGRAMQLSVSHLSVTTLEGAPGAWQVTGVNWLPGALS